MLCNLRVDELEDLCLPFAHACAEHALRKLRITGARFRGIGPDLVIVSVLRRTCYIADIAFNGGNAVIPEAVYDGIGVGCTLAAAVENRIVCTEIVTVILGGDRETLRPAVYKRIDVIHHGLGEGIGAEAGDERPAMNSSGVPSLSRSLNA